MFQATSQVRTRQLLLADAPITASFVGVAFAATTTAAADVAHLGEQGTEVHDPVNFVSESWFVLGNDTGSMGNICGIEVKTPVTDKFFSLLENVDFSLRRNHRILKKKLFWSS